MSLKWAGGVTIRTGATFLGPYDSILSSAAIKQDSPSLTMSILIGLFAGGLSGLFGVGGGILIVPALTLVGHMEQRLAHGTSLAATAPLALAGLVGYTIGGEVDWAVAFLLLLGSVVGAYVGAGLLEKISQRWLTYGFALLLLLTAIRMLITATDGAGRGPIDVLMAVSLIGVGLFSGSIAGLMGVGGGIIMVPAGVVLFGLPSATAKGTSLAVIVPTAIVGTWRNLRAGNADLRVAAGVGAAGVVSSFLGSQVSIDMDPRLSAVLFAVLLVVAAVRLLLRRVALDRAAA